MRNTQSDLAINIVLIQELAAKDVYFFLRMGLRPDIHKEKYPEIPIVLPPKQEMKEKPISFTYGTDPYKEIRMSMDPKLHREYYPE